MSVEPARKEVKDLVACSGARPDYSSFSPSEITEALSQLAALEAGVISAKISLVAALDSTAAYKEDGATCGSDWLAMRFQMMPKDARDFVATARALQDLPEIATGLSEGEIAYEIAKYVTKFAEPATDHDLAHLAPSWSPTEARYRARMFHRKTTEAADAVGLEVGEEVTSVLHAHWEAGQRAYRLNALFGPSDGAVIEAGLKYLTSTYTPDPETNMFAPVPIGAAEALVEMASRSLDGAGDPDRATVVVHVDAEVLQSGIGNAQVGSGITTGIVARRLACDSRLQVVIDDVNRNPKAIGTTSRTIPPRIARLIRHRDQRCVFPGCSRERWLEIHHIVHVADGGLTVVENLALLCKSHHRAHHDGRWEIRGTPSKGLTFLTPGGRPLANGPPPLSEKVRSRVKKATGFGL